MLSIHKRYLILILCTLVVAIIIHHVQNIEPIKNEKLFDFPLIIKKWKGTDIPMEDWVFKSLETPYSILRNYTSPEGERIGLTIVWYDDREIAFHGAAACLGGAGNKVTDMSFYQLNIDNDYEFTMGKLLTNKLSIQHMVLYYYISDGFLTANQIELRKHIILKRIKFKRTSAAFIRIMMPIIKDRAETLKIMEDFIKMSLPAIIKYTDTNALL